MEPITGFSPEAAEQVLRSFDGSDFKSDNIDEPDYPRHIGEMVRIKLGTIYPEIPARVTGVHRFISKVKYDLEIAYDAPDSWRTTRIYNVDSDIIISNI